METKPVVYTEEYVKSQVDYILELILTNKDIVYLGEVFEDLPYSRQRFSEWEKSFEENDEISDTIKKIKGILESRVNVGALKSKLNATIAIFNLKNNYGWKDKTEMDLTTNGKDINKINELADNVIKDD